MSKKDAMSATDFGYVPHGGQKSFVCDCGSRLFRTFPQGISVDAKVWCHEYVCAGCGRYYGIEVLRCEE